MYDLHLMSLYLQNACNAAAVLHYSPLGLLHRALATHNSSSTAMGKKLSPSTKTACSMQDASKATKSLVDSATAAGQQLLTPHRTVFSAVLWVSRHACSET